LQHSKNSQELGASLMPTSKTIELPKIKGLEFKLIPGVDHLAACSNGTIWSCVKRIGNRKEFEISQFWWERKIRLNEKRGYMQIVNKKKTYFVHKLILLAFHGDKPNGFEACHNDGNKLNNRPDNLRWCSHKSNCADKERHGTNLKGEDLKQSKLTEKQVIEIRKKPGVSLRHFSKKFGVSIPTICEAKNGRTWKHVQIFNQGA